MARLLSRRSLLARAAGLGGGVLIQGQPLLAQMSGIPASASPWSKGLHAAVRLIDGGSHAGDPGQRRAGLEITLDPDFKTYWRNPGDSGIPPTLDWSASRNIADVVARWPLPSRFADGTGSIIGYHNRLLLPLDVTLVNGAKEAVLVMKLDYAVCSQICIPNQAELTLKLPPVSLRTPFAALLDDMMAGVPKPVSETEAVGLGLGLPVAAPDDRSIACTWQPARGKVKDLFVEGPENWLFGTPERAPIGDGRVRLSMPVKSRPDGGTLASLPVRITAALDQSAVEVQTTVAKAGTPR